jgi:ABC-type multidrug transport system fused ATPase/permease subunit
MSYQMVISIFNRRIFEHSLVLTPGARQKKQVGDIVNHMSSDSENVADFPQMSGDMLNNVVIILGVVIMLFFLMGVSAIPALVVMVLMTPMTRYIAKRFTALDVELMKHRDDRVTMMTQVLNAIRVVKYFAWEKSVSKEVREVRGKEIAARRKLAHSEVLSSGLYMASSAIVLFIALGTHALRGNSLDAALIFTCISLFDLLDGPLGNLSQMISRTTSAYVGAGRIIEFLKESRLPARPESQTEKSEPVELKVQNLTVTHEGATAPVLQNISLQVSPGTSLAIVGPVGSGKSTVLHSLLGELQTDAAAIQFFKPDGTKVTTPRTAYVSQEAFIINGTLLENILFGEDSTGAEIRKAVHSSCLDKDIKEWKGGLRTEIGEKGVNLSGGQKQRVSLARAYLQKAGLILLDDPLSAVDGDTEKLLCDRLLFGAWKEVTRIVVTHRLEHLGQFDQIAYLDNGKILGMGSFLELRQSCKEFADFYSEHSKAQGEHTVAQKIDTAIASEVVSEAEIDAGRITEDEDREVGAVKSSVYWDYLMSLGGINRKSRPWILATLGLGVVIVNIMPLMQKAWLSYYSGHQSIWAALPAVGIYGVIGIAVIATGLLNNFMWLERGIISGTNMHDKMLQSVLHSPIRFFDSTPVGRVLQRFSRDVESVDVYMQWSFIGVINCAMQVVVSLFLILTVLPLMIVAIVPIMTAYYLLQKRYRYPAREVKRYDSVTRSPRYAHFKETLHGLSVIRGFNKGPWFMESFYSKLETNHRAFHSHYMLNRWFSTRIPVLGGTMAICTAMGAAMSSYYGAISAGTAGLLTIYSLSFWQFLNWGVRMFADIESRMTSIERLKFFSNLPSEKDTVKTAAEPLRASWPEKGEVIVENIQVRYAPHLPLVLKGVSCQVQAGTKVGIIGRTGSGKSTFLQTLFRFIELEAGRILVDGVDIATVPLERLRRSLAIIPQDPTLFLGTIRSNLDRYNEYSDDEVYKALKHASMRETVSALPQGLNSLITEGGQNLSQGQRQLLCMARALLTGAKIIVMDEATASVDVQTDAILQEVIRRELKNVTLMIIAHRLGTVKDCDQILEIADGKSVAKVSTETLQTLS